MVTPGLRVVGISEFVATADKSDTLVTYSLGSCVGLSLYDAVTGVGGLLHAMMPVSSMDRARAVSNPAMFADTGVAALLQAMFYLGATRRNLVAKVAGGASQVDEGDRFRIGERNFSVLRRVLWKNDVLIAAQDCGGARSRTLILEMETGRTLVKSNGDLQEL